LIPVAWASVPACREAAFYQGIVALKAGTEARPNKKQPGLRAAALNPTAVWRRMSQAVGAISADGHFQESHAAAAIGWRSTWKPSLVS